MKEYLLDTHIFINAYIKPEILEKALPKLLMEIIKNTLVL